MIRYLHYNIGDHIYSYGLTEFKAWISNHAIVLFNDVITIPQIQRRRS